MENLNLLDFSDALSSVPNVTVEPGSKSAVGVSGGGNSFLASMYIDGVLLPQNMMDGDLSTV